MKKLKVLFCLLLLTVVISLNIQVKAAEQLPDDGAKISSAQIIQTKTGTGPWDDNDEPGNDSSEFNNTVRSFDQVTWTVENTMGLNGGGSESYSGGKIYFEIKLPDSLNSETASWSLEDMAWIENPQVSADKMTLSGCYSMSSESITIPGKQTLVFVAKIFGAKNGTTFNPELKVWLNGNDENEKKNVLLGDVVVSAVPKYNVKLQNNPGLSKETSFTENGITTTGRVYGYGIVLQLYNDNSSKGLKGIEYPSGEISFDVDLQLQKISTINTSMQADITNTSTPILYNYK